MMYSNSDRSLASVVRATAIAVALCFALAQPARAADEPQRDQAAQTQPPTAKAAPAVSGASKTFTEEDVNAAVEEDSR